MAFDEAGNGLLHMVEFSSAFQQAGLAQSLSKGLIEAIGRRFSATERANPVIDGGSVVKIVCYRELLDLVKRELEQVLEMQKRKQTMDRYREPSPMEMPEYEDSSDPIRERTRAPQRKLPDDNFRDPFFQKGKATKKSEGAARGVRSAWRGGKGHAPSVIPGSVEKKKALPKYLRKVESRIGGELQARRVIQAEARKYRMECAKETVAGRRLDRYEATGAFDDAAAATPKEMSKGLLAREIADMYSDVADDVLQGNYEKAADGFAGNSALFGEVKGEGGEEKEEKEEGMQFKSSKAAYNTEWVGEFDLTKKSTVKDKDVMRGAGGEDVTQAIVEAKGREGSGEEGGEGEGNAKE